MAVEVAHRFPSDEHGNRLPIIAAVRGCTATGTPEARQAALADLVRFQSPAPGRVIEGWLAELSVITAKRQDDQFAETLRIEAYATRLARYPADVARSALLDRTYKFWPTWAELETACESMAAPRRAMIRALEAKPTEQATKTNHERVTADAATRILAEIWGPTDV